MENWWSSHWELQTEANLVLINYQGLFYQMAPLKLLGFVTLRVPVLERVVPWVIQKELGFSIN